MEKDHKETTTKEERGPFFDWDRKAKGEAQQLADKVTDWLNGSNHNIQHFFTAMDREHRYLQGEFANLCVEYLLHCAKEDYGCDARNCHNVKFGRLMEYALDNAMNLPVDLSVPQ